MRKENKMTLENGYSFVSTFPMDFSIADKFGVAAIKDTFNRAFREWKSNYIYLTELVITLNLKIWQHYNHGNTETAKVYNELWQTADAYACDNLKGDELSFFYRITD